MHHKVLVWCKADSNLSYVVHILLYTYVVNRPTGIKLYACFEVLAVHSNELHLFLAMALSQLSNGFLHAMTQRSRNQRRMF